jgi:sulfate adenylyltransferase (ADP) / ATP adenylyltransferase
VKFQLRYCPALSKKPVAGKPEPEGSELKPKFNPFENPSDALLVARLPTDNIATPNLVLNKYPVIARHSILSTVGFKRQTDFLESQDLDVTYACLQAWEAQSTDRTPARLFAFFNSGEHSGASQSHRHLQLLPVEAMMGPSSQNPGWQPLIDMMTEPFPDHPGLLRSPSLDFCHYAMKIPANHEAGVLHQIYFRLYDIASKAAQSWNKEHLAEGQAVNSNYGEASLSYNLAMTTDAMAICPRCKEDAMIPNNSGGGSAAVNGTILGGTLMVKEAEEWESLRQGRVMIDDILAEIGMPASSPREDLLSTRL